MTDLIYVDGTSPGAVCYGVRRRIEAEGYSGSVALKDAITVSALCWVQDELNPFLAKAYAVSPSRVPEKHRRVWRKQCQKYVRQNLTSHPECTSIAGIILSIKIIFLIARIVRLVIEWRLSKSGEAYTLATQAAGAREQ